MNCPRCNSILIISNTQGVEIDHCPTCRGVWLDRGELEKIIERSNSYSSPPMTGSNYPGYNNDHHDDHHGDHHDKHYDKHHDNQYGYGHQQRHKKGFLSDLFDF